MEQDSVDFRALTYLQFLICPELFDQYVNTDVNQLSNTDCDTIRDTFVLHTMTLMDWLRKEMPAGQPNQQTMWTCITTKSRNKAMFQLLLKIALKMPLNQDFFKDFTKGRKTEYDAFLRYRVFSGLFLQKLMQLQKIDPILPQFVNDLFTIEDINAATKQDMLKIHILHFQDNYHMKVLKIEKSANQELKRQYSNLLLQITVALKIYSTLKQLFNMVGHLCDSPEKYQKYIRLIGQAPIEMMNIEQPEYQQNVTVAPNTNTFFSRMRPRDKATYFQKKLAELFRSHSSEDGKKLRSLAQNQIRESNDEKGSYYCILLAIKLFFCSASDCQKPTFINQIQHDYSEITQLAEPSLKSLGWLILALSYCSNHFGQQSLTEMISFVGKILSARKTNDKDFLSIVMIQGLMEARQDNHINADFWKYLILENKPLFQYYGSYEAYTIILEMSLAIFVRKNADKSYTIPISEMKLTQLFEIKSQFNHQDNFTETQMLTICQTIVRITEQLQLSNQLHRVTAFKLQFISQNSDELARDICLYLSTYFYSYKVLVERPPETPDTRIIFKILSFLLWNSSRQADAIVSLTLADELLDVQKLHTILSSRAVVIPQTVYPYINSITVFQILVRVSATMKEDVKRLTRWIFHDDNHLFNGEVRKRKVLFRKQIAFVNYLLQNI